MYHIPPLHLIKLYSVDKLYWQLRNPTMIVELNYDKDDKRHTCQIEKNTKYNKILFKYGVNLRKINIIYFIVTRQS